MSSSFSFIEVSQTIRLSFLTYDATCAEIADEISE